MFAPREFHRKDLVRMNFLSITVLKDLEMAITSAMGTKEETRISKIHKSASRKYITKSKGHTLPVGSPVHIGSRSQVKR